MSFLIQRSSSTAKNKGVFGRELEELLAAQKETVPFVVQDCISFLTERGLDTEGLFRISGHQPTIELLKGMYNENPLGHVDFNSFSAENIHTVAGLLKVYFRELPSPLLTFRFYETFIKVQKNEDKEARLKNLRILLWGLPSANRNLLLYLMKFLKTFAQHSDKTKMPPSNIALCWAPNLLKAETESIQQVMINTEHVNSIIMTLIENIDFMVVEKKRNATISVIRQPPAPQKKSANAVPSFKREEVPDVVVQYPEMYGWLQKQGGGYKSWKKRWFILKDLVLAYHKQPKETPLGTIPLPGYLCTKADGEVNKPYPFKLFHEGPCRTWYFSAPSSQERDRWIKSIEESVSFLKEAIETKQNLITKAKSLEQVTTKPESSDDSGSEAEDHENQNGEPKRKESGTEIKESPENLSFLEKQNQDQDTQSHSESKEVVPAIIEETEKVLEKVEPTPETKDVVLNGDAHPKQPIFDTIEHTIEEPPKEIGVAEEVRGESVVEEEITRET